MNNKKTALLLIDLQKEGDFGLFGMESVIKNTKEVIEACRNAGIPIIYTRQINRADAVGLSKGEPLTEEGKPFFYASDSEKIEIIDEIKPLENDIVIDKYRWSAFYETNLELILKSLGTSDIIIGGVVTDGCLMTSAYDAYFRDYNLHLIEDICTASNEGVHQSAMMIMANWIYNLKIYNTKNIVECLKGNAYSAWESDKVDSLQFTAGTMQEQYNKIKQGTGE